MSLIINYQITLLTNVRSCIDNTITQLKSSKINKRCTIPTIEGKLIAKAKRIIKLTEPKICEIFDKFCQSLCFLKSLPQSIIAIAKLRNAKKAERLCILFSIVGNSLGKLVGKIAIKNNEIHHMPRENLLKIGVFVY